MKHYFNRFQTINYNGSLAKNILTRIVFDERTKGSSENFAFFKIQNDLALRPDIISENFYDSPYYDWLFYMSNSVVDPYHDVFLDASAFQNYIVSKYGSIGIANEKISHYINNWADNTDVKLTTDQYEESSQAVKKYYTAEIDYLNRIIAYKRHQLDWTKETNKIRILTLNDTEYLFVGSLITQTLNGSITAKGEIVDVNRSDNKITVKNITGEFVTSVNNILKKYNIPLTYTVTESVNPHTEDNIPLAESSFWTPVTVYDYEQELNESKRNTKLIRKSLISDVEEQFEKLMEE